MAPFGRRVSVSFSLVVALLGVDAATASAQPVTGSVRTALVPQWVVSQHRGPGGPGSLRSMTPEFQAALDRGVVDRVVFRWQRGVIQREALVWKPVRVLAGPEAEALGGRGTFELASVRPPSGPAAWTEIEVAARTARPDDILVLELGGELNTLRQVLDTVFVASAHGSLAELGLARRALIPGDGVPVIAVPFGRPVTVAGGPALFRGTAGIEFLVARSQIEAIPNGAITANGFGDLSPFRGGEWREGDRVFLRVPIATLRAGTPAVVLGWRDRQYRPDGGDANEFRRP
ncbi:MAG: hypothetical protein ACRDHK_07470 [Actinomycetota bacterium]